MAEKIVVSLTSVFSAPKAKRARRAMRKIRGEIAGRFHSMPENVVISARVNHAVFSRGFAKAPRRISVMVQQDKETIKAFLAGEKIPEKKEDKKEKKEERKEEKEEEEAVKKKKEKRALERAAEKTAIKLKTDRV